ncbi:uncharacterized protein LAESUDRAFT_764018 [Laetiporus sulphureus 93-53]|uniref:DUF6534 domain-containing protein n=1 Tax=Laetiporus sulphureus 93-53 TaxID=1314785 RepID=A0A165BHX5_9APHY|nr:uncharacterized protein LAESUDRAFT_764018 [Laetiporus sulphureus 93-53]KZT01092.1 hypothetical protein LAESUDRAFT_764018 [Laetiporus sulphureus 93-53]
MSAEIIKDAQLIDGPGLAGVFMNVMLYGVLITQTFFYFTTYPHDPKWLKYYVSLLFFADTLNTIFNIWWIYNVLINNFGNVNAVVRANWLMQTEEAFAGIIGMQVQLFYAWRIYKLTGYKYLTAVIIGTSVIQCLCAIGTAINIAFEPVFTRFAHYKEVVVIWLSVSAVTDVLIVSTLTWHLRRSRTGYAQTDTIISRVMQITVSNGLLTASFAIATLIAFVSSTAAYHLAFNYTLCKLYGNSLMTSLNSRYIIGSARFKTQSIQLPPITGTTTDVDDFMFSRNHLPTQPARVVVNVETTQMVDISPEVSKASGPWAEEDIVDSKAGVAV